MISYEYKLEGESVRNATREQQTKPFLCTTDGRSYSIFLELHNSIYGAQNSCCNSGCGCNRGRGCSADRSVQEIAEGRGDP